ncbi:MAG TPA: class I SAM-dependent methyltransferase [Candidatus Dormibacteraeota bacterium]|nr:class I SAM-dependent methyltransferase [Candidatus Dormibacteraeota bacterium]
MSGPQRAAEPPTFYEAGAHEHLRAQPGDRYATRIAAALAAQAGLRPTDHVLELGAGFGRFTFALLDHCASVTALDLSPRMLGELERARDAHGIPAERCRVVHADADAVDAALLARPVQAVVGFFFLHHVRDYRRTIAALAPLVTPGGALAFVEPNRVNPLYLAQILFCPDMHWREEKGLYRIGARGLTAALTAAGLRDVRLSRFGFFPPQLINGSDLAARLEPRLERTRLLGPMLPFVLVSGHRAADIAT